MKPASILILVLISTIFSLSYSQVEIELYKGQKFEGIVINNTKDSLSINTFNNRKISFSKNEIEHIEPLSSTIRLLNGKTITGYVSKMTDDVITIILNNDDVPDVERTIKRKEIIELKHGRVYKDNYAMLGLSFGLPGGINAIWGYHFGKIGSRAEFGFFPGDDFMAGVQANFLLNLFQNRNFETNLSIGTGYFQQGNDDYVYIGPFYDLNFYGVFLELGLGFGSGKYTSPQFLAQIGYVFRFN